MPITLQALFAPDRRALQFAIKTLIGGELALQSVTSGGEFWTA
ncbi:MULTISPECIES: hypothetical protein [unclassified Pseudomonas]|nr:MULTISPECIES: hypothetical protein [unclassified Pseudomonas]